MCLCVYVCSKCALVLGLHAVSAPVARCTVHIGGVHFCGVGGCGPGVKIDLVQHRLEA